jgi:hypothetical protein
MDQRDHRALELLVALMGLVWHSSSLAAVGRPWSPSSIVGGRGAEAHLPTPTHMYRVLNPKAKATPFFRVFFMKWRFCCVFPDKKIGFFLSAQDQPGRKKQCRFFPTAGCSSQQPEAEARRRRSQKKPEARRSQKPEEAIWPGSKI